MEKGVENSGSLGDSSGVIGAIELIHKILRRPHTTNVEIETIIKDEAKKLPDVYRLLQKKFEFLTQEWKSATAHLSSITEISLHPAYQRIIGMGETAVPFILNEISDSPGHWFWALKAITADDPVPPEHSGRIDLMTEDWLAWGRAKGYIS
jgi:hypothetical protein